MPDMWQMLGALPDQLRWASSLTLRGHEGARSLAVAGMGGSGIAGDVVSLMAAAEGQSVASVKQYDLPAWVVGPDWLVLVVSYSGNTEESRAVAAQAHDRDARVAVVCGGGALAASAGEHGWPSAEVPPGFQPRAAFGYLAGAALMMAEAHGFVTNVRSALDEAAVAAEHALGQRRNEALELAERIGRRPAVVYGSPGLTGLAARRWKTQINENAKALAWFSEVPESNHNELEAWLSGDPVTPDQAALVLLRDPSEHPRIAKRFDLMEDLLSPLVAGSVTAAEGGLLSRLLSLVVIGDVLSVALAEAHEIDPIPVETLESFKRKLSNE